ncbi:MAG TPA: DoxX family protein [Thermoanaerobaculia bacterium]|nr:DoxX family protein [Thermoanaerobaculia bacterium]
MTNNHPSRGLNIALWAAQILLALFFGAVGLMKTMTPIDELAKTIPLAGSLPFLTRFIGISELAGALGLLLPAWTRILPVLTPIAGIALAVVMVLATGYHAMRGEFQSFPITIGLGALSAFVAWGRLTRAGIRRGAAHPSMG